MIVMMDVGIQRLSVVLVEIEEMENGRTMIVRSGPVLREDSLDGRSTEE
jgi:hypothetical protein